MIEALESNAVYKAKCFGEPQLGKRGLYPTVSQKGNYDSVTAMKNFIAYADGKNDLIDISNIIDVPIEKIGRIAHELLNVDILSIIE